MTDTIGPMAARIDQQQLAQQLVDSAREEGVELVGPDGMLTGLTKTVLETALEAELDEHLGYQAHDAAGRDGGNSRNGTRPKTVLTEIGPVQIEVLSGGNREPGPGPLAGGHHVGGVERRVRPYYYRSRATDAFRGGQCVGEQLGRPTHRVDRAAPQPGPRRSPARW